MLDALDLTHEDAHMAFIYFFNSIGINTQINTLINNFEPNIIADNINIERLSNNPRKVTKEAVLNFLAGQL